MPGFQVQDFSRSSGPTDKIDIYYSYTWDIENILGKNGKTLPIILLKDATTPTFTVGKESYIASSLEYKFAKNVSWDDIKLTWYDCVGMINVIREWRQSVWTERLGLQPAANYKKNTQLRCFLPTEGERYGWDLINSWPSIIRSGDLTYTNSDVKLVDITLTYDWAREIVVGAENVVD